MFDANMSEKLSALIVGCGNIAGGYDDGGANPDAVLTHAGAYRMHNGFEISACIDPDDQRRQYFMKRWNIGQGFADLTSCARSGLRFDVVSLCSPNASHRAALMELLDMPVRCVFAEKPLTGHVAGSQEIIDAYAAKNISLAVNYLRRWAPEMKRLRSDIAAGKWGRVRGASGSYAKGLFNCGSHLIDLIHFLVGTMSPRDVFSRVDDFTSDDPTLGVRLEFSNGAPVILMGKDSRDHFSFDLTLIMEKGEVVLDDLGRRICYRPAVAHPLFRSQITPAVVDPVDTGFDRAMLAALANIEDHLSTGAELLSNGRNAVQSERTCSEIMTLVGENALCRNEGERM